MAGTRLRIWKQGQFYPDLGKAIIELPYNVDRGPSDKHIKISGFDISPDQYGDFLAGEYSEAESDAIHTYGIARMIIDMFESLLKRPVSWSWWEHGEKVPLTIIIRQNDINACYLKEQRCIELDYYGTDDKLVFYCRSVDLIAHEVTHAIIDGIWPTTHQLDNNQQGIREALCDLSAMFWILRQKEMCKIVIDETNGDLNKNSILTLFGVGYGFENDLYCEIRNALLYTELKEENSSSYDYSQYLVGKLYQSLISNFDDDNHVHATLSEKLFFVGDKWMKSIISVFQQVPANVTEFLDLYRYESRLGQRSAMDF